MKISSVALDSPGQGFVYVNGREISWSIMPEQWDAIQTILGIGEVEQCSYCHQIFFAPKGYDALKHHDQYCELKPESDEL